MINLSQVSIGYPDGTVAIKDLSMHISAGENVAIVGANGAGKSTLMMSLVGVLLPTKGEAVIDGISLNKKTLVGIRNHVGMVFQNPDDQLFMPRISDDIAFGPRNQGISEPEVSAIVDKVLTELHIEHLKERSTLKLSGGEKRTVAIATVLAMNPSILLFDEPSSFLDPKARRNLIHLLKSLPQTKIITTHDLRFAEEVCSRVIVLKRGQIFCEGEPSKLLRDERLMDECGLEAIESC